MRHGWESHLSPYVYVLSKFSVHVCTIGDGDFSDLPGSAFTAVFCMNHYLFPFSIFFLIVIIAFVIL